MKDLLLDVGLLCGGVICLVASHGIWGGQRVASMALMVVGVVSLFCWRQRGPI